MQNSMTSALVAKANARRALDAKKQVIAGMVEDTKFGVNPMIARLQHLLDQELTARTSCGFLSIFRRNRLPLPDASKALTALREATKLDSTDNSLVSALANCKKHFGSATYKQARASRVDGGRSLVTVSVAEAIKVLEDKLTAPAAVKAMQ